LWEFSGAARFCGVMARNRGDDYSSMKCCFGRSSKLLPYILLERGDLEHLRARTAAWGTVHMPAQDFRRLAKPFEEWL